MQAPAACLARGVEKKGSARVFDWVPDWDEAKLYLERLADTLMDLTDTGRSLDQFLVCAHQFGKSFFFSS